MIFYLDLRALINASFVELDPNYKLLIEVVESY